MAQRGAAMNIEGLVLTDEVFKIAVLKFHRFAKICPPVPHPFVQKLLI
jgi:hypothetical protein